ncbi:MAG: chorismate-binding protein [Aquificaceae bacterium]
MRLLLCGDWLGQRDLYEAKIKKLYLLESLQDLPPVNFGFLVLSYHLAEETLRLSIKPTPYPKLILLELEDFLPFSKEEKGAKLKLLSYSFSPEGYMKGVEKVKDLISQGVVYQLNLTCAFDLMLKGDPIDLFISYYKNQPVPYAFFLDLGNFYLLSGSMELFLEKRGELLISKPIKGTGKSREELEKSRKDKAENLMITDMVRNDLSRVALRGSVKVEELFKIEEFRTLFQMHSSVVARTREGAKRILLETFPPASVVGAPKRKAVEIIDLLEPHSRDYYCGCAGLLKEEDFTLSVLIRTAIGSGDKLTYFAGAGIVWDSKPEMEWEEILLKSRAFMGA